MKQLILALQTLTNVAWFGCMIHYKNPLFGFIGAAGLVTQLLTILLLHEKPVELNKKQ